MLALCSCGLLLLSGITVPKGKRCNCTRHVRVSSPDPPQAGEPSAFLSHQSQKLLSPRDLLLLLLHSEAFQSTPRLRTFVKGQHALSKRVLLI
ncbi:MAG: hypothetical protein FRX49_13434 [Trebouxia sp. A1-2]|nr:MAG: hypothetical protein FRX49_13434 [Trebouxia sp. A1-2]